MEVDRSKTDSASTRFMKKLIMVLLPACRFDDKALAARERLPVARTPMAEDKEGIEHTSKQYLYPSSDLAMVEDGRIEASGI